MEKYESCMKAERKRYEHCDGLSVVHYSSVEKTEKAAMTHLQYMARPI